MTVLQTTDLPEHATARVAETFEIRRLPANGTEREAFLLQHGLEFKGIIGTGKGRVDGVLLDQLPNLRIVSSYSAGLDAIDVDECERRGIVVANTSHVLADDVADLAYWLVMGSARQLVRAHEFVASGQWGKVEFPLSQSMSGLKVGILGLGHIGKALARRLEVSRAEIGYHGRHSQAVAYPYFSTLIALARWCDTLVVCCPATPETKGIVNAEIIDAIGPQGHVVNIARGSAIDEPALVLAIENASLGSAGLDVFENEPSVPEILVKSPKVITLPHIGSATEQVRTAMGEAMVLRLKEALL